MDPERGVVLELLMSEFWQSASRSSQNGRMAGPRMEGLGFLSSGLGCCGAVHQHFQWHLHWKVNICAGHLEQGSVFPNTRYNLPYRNVSGGHSSVLLTMSEAVQHSRLRVRFTTTSPVPAATGATGSQLEHDGSLGNAWCERVPRSIQETVMMNGFRDKRHPQIQSSSSAPRLHVRPVKLPANLGSGEPPSRPRTPPPLD